MSKLMDDAVINMPYEIAMSDEIYRMQFYNRSKDVLAERDEALAKLSAMESQEPVAVMYRTCGSLTKSECADDDIFDICCRAETPLYAKPVPADKPAARITEQDAREILKAWLHVDPWDFNKWIDTDGRTLLNKLNADREQVSDVAPAKEQWSYYQTLLKKNGFDGITDLLAKYHKLVEQVPAVAVPCKKTVEMCARFLEGQRYMVLSPTETYSATQHTQKLKHSVNHLADLMRRTITPSHSQQSAGAHDKNAQRYLWIKENIQEELTQGSLKDSEYAEHKTRYKLPLLISWADFCGNISLDDAIDNQISRGYRCPSHESEQSASPAPDSEGE